MEVYRFAVIGDGNSSAFDKFQQRKEGSDQLASVLLVVKKRGEAALLLFIKSSQQVDDS